MEAIGFLRDRATRSDIVRRTGLGLSRVNLSLARLVDQGRVQVIDQVARTKGPRHSRQLYAAIERVFSNPTNSAIAAVL